MTEIEQEIELESWQSISKKMRVLHEAVLNDFDKGTLSYMCHHLIAEMDGEVIRMATVHEEVA